MKKKINIGDICETDNGEQVIALSTIENNNTQVFVVRLRNMYFNINNGDFSDRCFHINTNKLFPICLCNFGGSNTWSEFIIDVIKEHMRVNGCNTDLPIWYYHFQNNNVKMPEIKKQNQIDNKKSMFINNNGVKMDKVVYSNINNIDECLDAINDLNVLIKEFNTTKEDGIDCEEEMKNIKKRLKKLTT